MVIPVQQIPVSSGSEDHSLCVEEWETVRLKLRLLLQTMSTIASPRTLKRGMSGDILQRYHVRDKECNPVIRKEKQEKHQRERWRNRVYTEDKTPMAHITACRV